MNNAKDVPFEVLVERLCYRYKKLPPEVEALDMDTITILAEIINADAEYEKRRENAEKIKQRLNKK